MARADRELLRAAQRAWLAFDAAESRWNASGSHNDYRDGTRLREVLAGRARAACASAAH